jgi:hypothetical protein
MILSIAASMGAPMSADDQLLYEARARNRMAAVAGLAGILVLVGSIVQLSGPHTSVDELTLDLITANKRFPLDLIAAVLNGIGSLAIAWTLAFLFGISRARRPEIKVFIKWIAIAGGVLAAVTGVAYAAIVAIKVHQFVTQGAQTYDEAKHLTGSGGLLALQLVGQAAALLLAVGFVLVALNAMRVGLLTRFMGYLGMAAGVLILFQITQVPIVQGYWLLAFAYLASGRWPTGVPPAWRSGRAEPWPASQGMRGRRMEPAAGPSRPAKPGATAEPQTVGAPTTSNGRTRDPSSKRKRKRRN